MALRVTQAAVVVEVEPSAAIERVTQAAVVVEVEPSAAIERVTQVLLIVEVEPLPPPDGPALQMMQM